MNNLMTANSPREVWVCAEKSSLAAKFAGSVAHCGLDFIQLRGRADLHERSTASRGGCALLLIIQSTAINSIEFALTAREFTGATTPILIISKIEQSQISQILTIKNIDFASEDASQDELIIRIRALIDRRSQPTPMEAMHFGKYTLDIHQNKILLNEENLFLSRVEQAIVALLFSNFGHIVSRENLMEVVDLNSRRSRHAGANSRSPDAQICRLRKILRLRENNYEISAIYGHGYCLNHATFQHANMIEEIQT